MQKNEAPYLLFGCACAAAKFSWRSDQIWAAAERLIIEREARLRRSDTSLLP